MTDLELIKLCAEAMGYTQITGSPIRDDDGKSYRPLHDDAQAMALVKKFGLNIDGIEPPSIDYWSVYTHEGLPPDTVAHSTNLNRAICECVAAKVEANRRFGQPHYGHGGIDDLPL